MKKNLAKDGSSQSIKKNQSQDLLDQEIRNDFQSSTLPRDKTSIKKTDSQSYSDLRSSLKKPSSTESPLSNRHTNNIHQAPNSDVEEEFNIKPSQIVKAQNSLIKQRQKSFTENSVSSRRNSAVINRSRQGSTTISRGGSISSTHRSSLHIEKTNSNSNLADSFVNSGTVSNNTFEVNPVRKPSISLSRNSSSGPKTASDNYVNTTPLVVKSRSPIVSQKREKEKFGKNSDAFDNQPINLNLEQEIELDLPIPVVSDQPIQLGLTPYSINSPETKHNSNTETITEPATTVLENSFSQDNQIIKSEETQSKPKSKKSKENKTKSSTKNSKNTVYDQFEMIDNHNNKANKVVPERSHQKDYNQKTMSSQTYNKDSVGFATLPNQIHQKAIRRGFQFSLMVAGESGLGKSTLLNSLFLTDIYDSNVYPGPTIRARKTVDVHETMVRIEENGVVLNLNVIDTPGYGDHLNNSGFGG